MTAAHFASMSPKLRRMLITVCAMTATIMQALDTTIANVALPYMQGSLSASLDQINWVLTSYIVAAAIMTAPIGWIADRFGRKKLFIVCVAGFTVASFLCALAQNIEEMVLFRLLQGMAGAALVPLSQSVLLDAYSAEERSQAMAIWGVGVMLGPIMGPTLGAWLTDNYSWHWVFLINLPIGVATVAGLFLFMGETNKQEHLRFDWFGFLALAVGIGSLQLLLDRGEQVGWFGASEIWVEMIATASGSAAPGVRCAVPIISTSRGDQRTRSSRSACGCRAARQAIACHLWLALASVDGKASCGPGARIILKPPLSVYRSGTLIGLQFRRPDSKHSSLFFASTIALTSQMPPPTMMIAATKRKIFAARRSRSSSSSLNCCCSFVI